MKLLPDIRSSSKTLGRGSIIAGNCNTAWMLVCKVNVWMHGVGVGSVSA